MDILTDNDGNQWRVVGTHYQVMVQRRASDSKLPEDDRDAWHSLGYFNRIDQALSWLLDQLLRMELDETESEDFVGLVGAMKRRIDDAAESWRASIA